MATYVDKQTPGQQTSLAQFTDPNTDSSARKYVSADAVQNNSPTDSTSNVEHIVNLGAGLKSLSFAVTLVAGQASLQLQQTVDQLRTVSGSADPTARQQLVSFTEADVNDDQQRLTAAAAAGFDTVDDPNLRDALQRRTGLYVSSARHGFLPTRSEGATAKTFNLTVAVVEEVRTDIDRSRGAVDNFHTTVLFDLPYDALTNVVGIRIFRAAIDGPTFTRPLATLSPVGIQRLQSFRGRKNEDPSQNQIALQQSGVPNAITNLNSFDPFTGLRTSANADVSLSVPPALPSQNQNFATTGAPVPPAFALIDRSVLEDVNSLSNIQRNPSYGFDNGSGPTAVSVAGNLNVGNKLGDKQQQQVLGSKSQQTLVVNRSNKLDFSELAFLTLDQTRSRRIGSWVEISYDDETVSYGKGYKYFVVTVDSNLQQSARSQVASAVVEGLRVPESPSLVVSHVDQTFVSLAITVGDQLVEKFEVYRFEDASDRAQATWAQTISDQVGFTQRPHQRNLLENNYLLIGECPNGLKVGGQFADTGVIPGRHYRYRVYSVDIFGNKSEVPFQLDAYVPDRQQQFVDLRAPSILAEVDAKTSSVRITFQSDDVHLEHLRLERRDLTLGQDTFSTPSSPPRVIFGKGRLAVGRKALEGERMYDPSPDVVWNGVFDPNTGKPQVFVDRTAAIDHIYQYIVWGEDRYGNRSSYALSNPLLVNRRPFINVPVGLSASLSFTATSAISGVQVSWIEGNLDKSAEDLIGDQAALSQSQIRTLYQVQRLKAGEERWLNFPLQSASVLFDPSTGTVPGVAPNFRPPYLDLNQTYSYRVQAVQTGSFVSNFSVPVSTFTGFPIAQPLNFVAKMPNVYQRPFYVMLNWETFERSGIVDRWEVQRAAVNNFAAARLNLKSPEDFSNIAFQPFRTVFRESSRFASAVSDPLGLATSGATIVGEHCYMDTQVDFGNSYFYRIRAVSPEGDASRWSYKGVKLTSAIFEQKWVPIFTDAEKLLLSQTYEPLQISKGNRMQGKSTVSLQPEFSKPDSARTAPRAAAPIGGE